MTETADVPNLTPIPDGPSLGADLVDALTSATEAATDLVAGALADVKPRLRGWLHAATAPVTLLAGIFLVALSPDATTRIGSAVFALSALVLFSVSATMHTGTGHWSKKTALFLKRLDHSSIYLLIAGSHTPFAILLLEGPARVTLLAIAWGGALAGMAFRVLWTEAPRWLYTPVYMLLGWAAVPFLGDFSRNGSAPVLVLLAAGGLLYTVGGVIYGLRRPNPFPRWFGFHEVFHSLTVLAFAAHFTSVALATYAAR
jgi:hemolysin III